MALRRDPVEKRRMIYQSVPVDVFHAGTCVHSNSPLSAEHSAAVGIMRNLIAMGFEVLHYGDTYVVMQLEHRWISKDAYGDMRIIHEILLMRELTDIEEQDYK